MANIKSCLFYLLSANLHFATLHADATQLRERTIDALGRMREIRYESVSELVRHEIKQKDYVSALRKVRWHQHQQPNDPAGFFLEGQILEALNSPENAIIAYKKSYALKKNEQSKERILQLEAILQQQKDELNAIATELFSPKAEPETETSSPDTSKSSEATNNKSPNSTLDNPPADMAILSKMRGLESLVFLYQSKIGPMETFSLDSLRKEKILTRETDFSELGELSLKNGKIHSSIFGSIAEINQSLDFFRAAVKEEQDGHTEKAFSLLWEKRFELGLSCLDYLLMLCEKLHYKEKTIELKEYLAQRRPHDFINLYDLAMYYYRENQTKKALNYFRQLEGFNNPYRTTASSKITELERGGSWELKQKFLEQKKQLFDKKAPDSDQEIPDSDQKAPDNLNPVSE